MLGKVFERFVEKSPIPVMIRIYAGTRPGCRPTRCLVCPDGPESVHSHRVVFDNLGHPQPRGPLDQALGARGVSGLRDTTSASLLSVYNKLNGVEPHTSAALGRYSATAREASLVAEVWGEDP
jgi:hypothetical protein